MTKEEKIYFRFFSHFAMRLLERYNISITFEEYISLCKLPYLRGSKIKTNKNNGYKYKYGKLIIKGVNVHVYKALSGNKPLLTAIDKSINK